jgi:RHS repeat-associated protein
MPAACRSMGYDGLDRLTTANGLWGAGSYSYDALDNLRASTVGTRNLQHNVDVATNRLTSLSGSQNLAFAYDANGNLTQRGGQGFAFDIGNRLQSATGKASYTYDGHGRRTQVNYPDGSWKMHIYAQDGTLLLTRSSSLVDTAYVYLGGKLLAETASVGGTTFTHTDALGSPVARTNAAGALVSRTQYEPYGATAAGAVPNGPGFTGHVNDPDTGLVYMQQRYFDPIAGRFLSVDPLVTDAKTGGHFGRYHYAENNPYRYMDPDGKDAVAVTFPDYNIAFGGTTWRNLGHAGALLINPANGVTRYYDFGRYGGTTGIVRNLPLANNVAMSGGVPTTASLAKVLAEVSKIAGNGGRIEGAYFSGANFSAMSSYAQGLVGKTAGHGGYGEWSPLCSCNTFQKDLLQKGGVETPSMIDPRPNSYIQKLQGAPGAQSFSFGSGGFQGVFRVSSLLESKQLDKELSK